MLAAALLVVLTGFPGDAGATLYMEPDQVLIDIVDVQWAPWPVISPDGEHWLMRTSLRNPSISELAQVELKLAGMRFSPVTLAPTRRGRSIELSIVRYPEMTSIEIENMPTDLRILNASWSPDGRRALFSTETPDGIELWVIDAEEARADRLTDPVISCSANEYPAWMPDGESIICSMIPDGYGNPPVENPVPAGPVIQETTGDEAPVRTLQDLLENPFDEDLFEYYMTSQLCIVHLDGSVEELGDPCIVWYFYPSPDGRYIIVSMLNRPFSYSVTAGRFSETIQVWDREGDPVYTVAEHPVRENIPIAVGSEFEGPRSVSWRGDSDATLCWVEALDGGDAAAEAELRDRIFTLPAPFQTPPDVLMEVETRFGDIQWGSDSLAIVYEWWWPTRNARAWRIRPGQPELDPELVFDHSWEDRYNDPGIPIMRMDERGSQLLLTSTDGGSIYLSGTGASPEGDRPFLDRMDLTTCETERLFRSQAPYYERPMEFLDDHNTQLLFMRESLDMYPCYFRRDLSTEDEQQLTFNENPFHMLDGMTKEVITYERDDGLPLSATLYLPPGYEPEDGPLPMIMWAYPQEFRSADAAGQMSGSPYRYDYLGWWSPVIWLTKGYAVLNDPTMPIIGEGDVQPNDTFVEQLVSSARAAVEEVVAMGVADPDRIAIGGHSYGAFMTMNLLAHSDLFAAGIAQTGAYNRTLTPFGFQSEDRNLWEARDVYIEMSPFMHADGIDEPVLMVHGQADNNSGTFPMQSERMFDALKGLGGTARLVMLPLESHGYRARESVLHLLWETQNWFGEHLGD